MKIALFVSVFSLALAATNVHAQNQRTVGPSSPATLELQDEPAPRHGKIYEEDRGIYTFKWDCYGNGDTQQSVCDLVEICTDESTCWCP